ncbi:MAG: ABC transporter permease [Muribaculaceae bacterium]|nr:ABC transporter permease [Muribaculaceae bacterium]
MVLDLFREISQTLGHNKVRTALTGIAVTWGIFMLIVLLSFARGITNSFDYRMASRNTESMTIWSGTTTIPYKGNRDGRRIKMKQHDIVTIKERNPESVVEVTSKISGNGKISSEKGSVSNGYTGSYPDGLSKSFNSELIAGRFINQKDMDEKAKVMVLPEYFAKQLFPPEGADAVGKRVNCNFLSFLIVGVYSSRWDRTIFIPFTTAAMMQPDNQDYGMISVDLKGLKNEEDALNAEKKVRNTLAVNHNFDPDDNNAVYINNYFTSALQTKKAMGILDMCVWVLGILTLLSGIVGISNIMFVTVKERTHEIGIRRAIGAKPSKILTQIITESIAITLIFGYIGIFLGTVVTQVIATLMGNNEVFRNPTVSMTIALEVTFVLILAGTVAGLFPALKALKVKPVEALRDE